MTGISSIFTFQKNQTIIILTGILPNPLHSPPPPLTITYTYLHTGECCMVSVPSRPWGRGVPHTAGQGCHTVVSSLLIYIPAHCRVLHGFCSVPSLGQRRPPYWGAGLSHCRTLSIVPFPQVTSQGDQTPHTPQLPSTCK